MGSVCDRRSAKLDIWYEIVGAHFSGTGLEYCPNRRSSEIQGTALGKSLRAWTCIHRSMPAGVAQSMHAFVGVPPQ